MIRLVVRYRDPRAISPRLNPGTQLKTEYLVVVSENSILGTPKKTNGSMSNYTSPNSLNFNSNLDASLNQSSIVNSPIKDSSPESRTQSVSDIGASASQVKYRVLLVHIDYFRYK